MYLILVTNQQSIIVGQQQLSLLYISTHILQYLCFVVLVLCRLKPKLPTFEQRHVVEVKVVDRTAGCKYSNYAVVEVHLSYLLTVVELQRVHHRKIVAAVATDLYQFGIAPSQHHAVFCVVACRQELLQADFSLVVPVLPFQLLLVEV